MILVMGNLKVITDRKLASMLLILFSLALLVQHGYTKPQSIYRNRFLLNKTECSNSRILDIDRSIARIMGFGPYGRNFPEADRDLKNYCKETTDLVAKCEEFFKTCYTHEIANVARIMIYSIRHNIRTFCRKKKSKKLTKLLEVTPCINRHRLNDSCIAGFVDDTRQLVPLDLDNDKIKYSCCNYVKSIRCVDTWLDVRPCTHNYKGILQDFINGLFQNFIDVMCGEYNESTTKCQELGPLPKARKQYKLKYKSPVFLLIELVSSVESYTGGV